MHATGGLDMAEVKRLKEKNYGIKEHILEGVKVRARVKEQIEGEKASSTLLGKQCANKYKPCITVIKTEESCREYEKDVVLDNQRDISTYITNYHRVMYSETSVDDEKQNWFLSFIEPSILCKDNIKLTENITEDELLLVLKSFNLSKSPGIDGLPIDFF